MTRPDPTQTDPNQSANVIAVVNTLSSCCITGVSEYHLARSSQGFVQPAMTLPLVFSCQKSVVFARNLANHRETTLFDSNRFDSIYTSFVAASALVKVCIKCRSAYTIV